MRRPRYFAFVSLLAWAIVVGVVAARDATADDRPLMAHAGGDALWVANVVPRVADPVGPLGAGASQTQPTNLTHIWVRPNQPGKPWRLLTTLPDRVTSMATRDSQLAVLLVGGQWMTVFDGGTASGQPLPADGQIVALADDGRTLWAIGVVPGGIERARAAIDRMAAATRPNFDGTYSLSTRPTTAAAVPPEPSRLPAALVAFRQDNGHWAAVVELPPDMVPDATSDGLSATVSGARLTVTARGKDGSLRTGSWHGTQWEDLPTVRPPGKLTEATFTLLGGTTGTALWTSAGPTDAGAIHVLAAGMPETEVRPLRWVGPPPLTGTPTAAIAGGYLRVIGFAGDKPYEQRYEVTGAPVGGPAEISTPSDLGDTPVMVLVQGLLLASLAFAIGTSIYRQVTPGSSLNIGTPAADDGTDPVFTLAPFGTRAAAGAIDLLPLVACVLVALVAQSHHPDAPASPGLVWLVVIGIAIYLGHTTVLETLTARSAGKWITGLRVATLGGARPANWQLVARNLLRVLDPLIWIVLSPQRQRTADVLAGTVVVQDAAPGDPSAPEKPSSDEPPSTPTEPGT